METTIKVYSYDQYGFTDIEYDSSTFPMGEPYVKIRTILTDTPKAYVIIAHIADANGFLKLLTLKDALDRLNHDSLIELNISYMPAGRQDRVMSEGESLSLKVYCNMINSCKFHCVRVLDPHSDVTAACLEGKVYIVDNRYLYERSITTIRTAEKIDEYYLISPDSGANKKIKDLAKTPVHMSQLLDVVYCDKTREVTTGKITGFKVHYDDLQGKACVIVDDICDGGGTFIGIAKELKKKNAGPIYLVVSHGLFTKGLDPLKEDFAGVFTHPHFFKTEDPTFLTNIIHPQF